MRQRWHSGIWLGHRFTSGEHVVALRGCGKVYRARSVKGMPEQTTLEDLVSIVGMSWSPTGALLPDTLEVPRHPGPCEPAVEGADFAVPRSMQITRGALGEVRL